MNFISITLMVTIAVELIGGADIPHTPHEDPDPLPVTRQVVVVANSSANVAATTTHGWKLV